MGCPGERYLAYQPVHQLGDSTTFTFSAAARLAAAAGRILSHPPDTRIREHAGAGKPVGLFRHTSGGQAPG